MAKAPPKKAINEFAQLACREGWSWDRLAAALQAFLAGRDPDRAVEVYAQEASQAGATGARRSPKAVPKGRVRVKIKRRVKRS